MPPAADTPLELTGDQAQIARMLSMNLKGFAALATIQGLLWIAVTVVLWFRHGSFWAGVLFLLVGGASAFTGLIALSTATDAQYVAEIPSYNRNHLANTISSINDYLGVLFGIGLLLTIILACILLF